MHGRRNSAFDRVWQDGLVDLTEVSVNCPGVLSGRATRPHDVIKSMPSSATEDAGVVIDFVCELQLVSGPRLLSKWLRRSTLIYIAARESDH